MASSIGKSRGHHNNLELAWASANIERNYWYKSIKFLLSLQNLDIFSNYSTKAGQSGVKSPEQRDNDPDERTTRAVERIERSGQGIFQSSGLRADDTSNYERRRRRPRWARLVSIFVVYMLIKSHIKVIALFSLFKHQVLVPMGYSQPWLSVDAAETIAYYLGNPLRGLPDASLIAQIGPPLFCGLFLIWFPKHLKRHQLNFVPLCFLFEPCNELKRVDLAIKQCIDDVKLSLYMYTNVRPQKLVDEWKLRQMGHLGGNALPGQRSLVELRDSIHREQLYCFELNEFLTELSSQHRLSKLRPATCSLEHYLKTTAKIGVLVVGVLLQYVAFWLISTFITEAFVYNSYCDEFLQSTADELQIIHNSSSSISTTALTSYCNPLHIFTLPELINLIELPATFILGVLIVALNIILTVIINNSQAELINAIRVELLGCKKQLLQYYDKSKSSCIAVKCDSNTDASGHRDRFSRPKLPSLQSHSLRINTIISNSKLKLASSLHLPGAFQSEFVADLKRRATGTDHGKGGVCRRHERSQQMSDRSNLDRLLLETLIRIMICEQEVVDNSRCLSKLSLMIFYYLFTASMIATLSKISKVSDSYYVRTYISFISLASFNAVAAAHARLYSRIVELQRIMWTILAANAQIVAGKCQMQPNEDQNDNDDDDDEIIHNCTHTSLDTFVSHSWRRFGLATSSSIERYCVRPFGFKFTYENIIRANFFFVSIYSLARGRL